MGQDQAQGMCQTYFGYRGARRFFAKENVIENCTAIHGWRTCDDLVAEEFAPNEALEDLLFRLGFIPTIRLRRYIRSMHATASVACVAPVALRASLMGLALMGKTRDSACTLLPL